MDITEAAESFTKQLHEKDSEIRRLRKALTVIAEWKTHDISLAKAFGDASLREYYRQVARIALQPQRRRKS